jgi:long-chain acyl-CoA synthetase
VHDSVVAMLDHTAAAFGPRPALVTDDDTLSYRELRRCVAGLARLVRREAPAGTRVATVLGNSLLAAIAPYAIAESGCVHVPLNPLYTARELGLMLDDCTPAAVLVDDALVPVVSPLAAAMPGCRVLPASDLASRLAAWRASEPPGSGAASPVAADTIALVQYTGGSTGRPKGVQLTHRAINTNIAQREALLPVARGTEKVVCVMPLFHSYAMAMGLYLSGYSGSALVILPGYHPERLLEAVERHAITIFPGSPTIFAGLMGCGRFTATDWSRVHTCYSGSAPLSQETLQRWEAATGSRVYEGYGQTEAGPVLTFNPSTGRTKIGSVGVPVPGTDVRIVDVETGTRVLPAGERGEVCARGPQVMSGYLHLEDETRESLRGGWLHTGDIGELDEDGYLSIRDRKKDLVIVGGYNVYPREVEEVLHGHPAILEAAVVGQPDAYRGEVLRAYVVLRPQAAPVTRDDLQAWCRQHLARYKVPAAFETLQELPKTSVNKIDKKPLRLRAAASR